MWRDWNFRILLSGEKSLVLAFFLKFGTFLKNIDVCLAIPLLLLAQNK